jgi:hypothetical protein
MSSICSRLHQHFNGMERFDFSFALSRIPLDGIYVLFERGEISHDVNRIVRVGTHTGSGQLPFRLRQHFITENKDRSIFRKNVGRALLHRASDPFLKDWEVDLTTRQARELHGARIDLQKLQATEREVSYYIRERFSFVVFAETDKARRLELETKIIATVSLCDECKPSPGWLGHQSPNQRIRESGLWLVNGLYKQPLSETEFHGFTDQLKAS